MKTKSKPERRQKKLANAAGETAPASPASPAIAGFPIVGIGASAGGLEALEQFPGRAPDELLRRRRALHTGGVRSPDF